MKKTFLSICFLLFLGSNLLAQNWVTLGTNLGKGDAQATISMFTYPSPCFGLTPDPQPGAAQLYVTPAQTCRYIYSGYEQALTNFKEEYIAYCRRNINDPNATLPAEFYQAMSSAFQFEMARNGF